MMKAPGQLKTHNMFPGQISIIPRPELRGFWGDSLTKPPFKVTSAEVVIICPDVTKPHLHDFHTKVLWSLRFGSKVRKNRPIN